MRSLQAQTGRCHGLGYHLYRQVHKTFFKENIEADIFENTEPKSMKNAETKKSLNLETQFFHWKKMKIYETDKTEIHQQMLENTETDI